MEEIYTKGVASSLIRKKSLIYKIRMKFYKSLYFRSEFKFLGTDFLRTDNLNIDYRTYISNLKEETHGGM